MLVPRWLKIELVLRPLQGVCERGEQRKTTLHMSNGFRMGGALGRPGTRLLPVGNGLPMSPGFGVVVSQEFGLGRDDLGKPGFEELCRLLKILLPGAFQQGGISSILDERMLEDVAGTRRPTPLIEAFGVHELSQPVLQRSLLHRRECLQEFVGKLPAQHGPSCATSRTVYRDLI